MAMTARAPACTAPCTAPEPTPPQPMTATTSPGFTRPPRPARPVARFPSAARGGGAESGGQTARDQGRRAQVVPGIDLEQRRLVHDDVLGEGAELRVAIEVLVTIVVTPGTVGDHGTSQRRGARSE